MKWIDRTIWKLQYKVDKLERELDIDNTDGGFWDFVNDFYEQGRR